jgi:uncharacterized protein (TIGR02611 family)
MLTGAKKVGIFLLGWVVILFGVIQLFTPGPGTLTILAGLFILSSEFLWAKKVLDWIRHRFPRFARLMDAAADKGKAWLWRLLRREPKEAERHAARVDRVRDSI